MSYFTKDYYPQFEIGRHTYGHPTIFDWGESVPLKIGAFCSIADSVKIFLGGEHRSDWATTYPFSKLWDEARNIPGHPATRGAVAIGNDVWLAVDSCVLSGVTIGDGVCIGARSVVVQDVPPYAIVFGNPAKILRYRFTPEIIADLQAIAWWNWPDEKIVEFLPMLLCQNIDEFIRKAKQ
jgi:acetyltransferase-like isoleucine patch superfamily enzyme